MLNVRVMFTLHWVHEIINNIGMTEENNNKEVKIEPKADIPVDSSVLPKEEKEVVAEKTSVNTDTVAAVAVKQQVGSEDDKKKTDFRDKNRGPRKGPRNGKQGGRRGSRRGFGERVKPEFDQKVIDIRRVTRVVSGGRRFSFSVALVAGNRKGSVGVGVGKSSDTSSAIEKASRNAKKNMIKIKLNKNMSIPHEVYTKFASTRVSLRPAPGKGLVAGSSVRNVLDLAGVKDVSSKLISRSKNKLNNARAAIEALKQF